MADIQTGKHQRKLSREFGIRGALVAPSVESSVQPVVIVSDLSGAEEGLTNELEVAGSAGLVFGPIAATNFVCMTIAPVAGMTVLVTKIQLISLLGIPVTIGFTTGGNLGVAGQNPQAWNREKGVRAAADVRGQTGAAGLVTFQGTSLFEYRPSSQALTVDDLSIVLDDPTDVLAVQAGAATANDFVTVNIFWREGQRGGNQP